VSEVGIWEDNEWTWTLGWRRYRFQWESELVNELLRVISRTKLIREEMDSQKWEGDTSGVFSVKTAYERLTKSSTDGPNAIFNLLWQVKAYPNVLVTAWRALLDKLPTKTNLMRRGVMINNQLCVLCGGGNETVQHLFVECSVAQRVWNRCFRWMGIVFAQHRELTCHLEQFSF